MSKIDKSEGAVARPPSFIQRIAEAASSALKKRGSGTSPLYDIAIAVVALIVSRCHVIFGAYPLGIAMVAILPERVWLAVIGSAIGSLTLGKAGIVYALIVVIVAFLRLIISGTGTGENRFFGEKLLLKMSSALIGGFISAVYEILLGGFTTGTVAYGLSMILLPPTVAFAISGLFDSGVTASAVFLGTSEVFSLKRREESERMSILFFQGSALFAVFLISLSLEQYELLGISAGYLFAAVTTIFTARRFGAIRGAAVGFVASVGLSGVYSVAFLLAGLAAGALSSFGIIYSALAGGVALAVWGAYSGGVVGLLSLFPEYAIAAAVSVPLFKKTRLERTPEALAEAENIAEDMVGTMALSYKSKYSGSLDTLESSFSSLSTLLKRVRRDEETVTESEASRLVVECISRYFDTENPNIPGALEARSKFFENVDNVSTILYKTKKVTPECFNTPPHLSAIAAGISDSINRALAILTEEKYRERVRDSSAEDFEYISKLINEARLRDECEKTVNAALTERVKTILLEEGISGSGVQVYGERAPHFIIATEDESGTLITSPKIRSRLEEAASVRLATPEFYRKGKMALMECRTAPKREVECAHAETDSNETEVSGDYSISFDTREGRHFSIISDGEGRGRDARRASGFVTEFLSRALEFGAGCESALRLLNSTMKHRSSVTSATVDIFSLDLITGEAMFYKCGAAPSYIKRGSSLFRIRSRTSPIGPLSELDAERIRVECAVGDYVIMLSDGISQDGEDAPWLLELLAKPIGKNTTPASLAEDILHAAKKHSASGDDMTVRVIRIDGTA